MASGFDTSGSTQMTPSVVQADLQIIGACIALAGMSVGFLFWRLFRTSAWLNAKATEYVLVALFAGCYIAGSVTSHRWLNFAALFLMFATVPVGARVPDKDKRQPSNTDKQ